jgi:hypothetical protein
MNSILDPRFSLDRHLPVIVTFRAAKVAERFAVLSEERSKLREEALRLGCADQLGTRD